MIKFAAISLTAAGLVSALDVYFALQIADSLNPYSLSCASSQGIMFMRTQSAAVLLIPMLAGALVVFGFSRGRLNPTWRVVSFLPTAVGMGGLVVTKFLNLW